MSRERRLPTIDAVEELLEHTELPRVRRKLPDVVVQDLERATSEADTRYGALVEQIPRWCLSRRRSNSHDFVRGRIGDVHG